MSSQEPPQDWKNYEDFAAGIDTNRLPPSKALAGRKIDASFEGGGAMVLRFAADTVSWSDAQDSGTDSCDVVEVAADTYFVDIAFSSRPKQAVTLILNLASRRALSIRSVILEPGARPGEPLVAQQFRAGIIADATRPLASMAPAPTRVLIGLRAHFTYSPQHVYEHTYLSSQRYCWQCLVGVQRGHGDVDLTTTYKFDDNQYIFTFREFLIPVASVFFYNFATMRSTGKFLGITADGRVENSRAGARIRKASMTYYLPGEEPV
ncbi:MAG: MoaF C-terminal domain-containing protein [Xanthobacteraceae bacterium]